MNTPEKPHLSHVVEERPTGQPEKASAYKISREGDVLRLSFGAPAQNDHIVRDAVACLDEMGQSGELDGGGLIKLNGPASLPVAVAIANALSGRFEAVAVFDPKLNGYIISVTNSPNYELGSIISAKD